jgi:lipopolysaccharide export system permease protein
MKLLPTYILTTFAKIFTFVLPVFVALYMVVEFVERLDDFVEHQAGMETLLLYFLLRAPVVAVQIASFGILLSVALAIALLERSRELIAFLAAGASPWHLISPFLLASLVIAGINLIAEEYLLPSAHRGLMNLQKNRQGFPPQGVLLQQGEIWLRTPEAAFVHIELVDPGGERVHGITIYRKDRDGDLFEQVEAREAIWLADHWTLLQGTISRFRENLTTTVEPFTRLTMSIGIEPEALRSVFRPPSHMSLSALRSYMRKLQDRGVDMTAYARDFQLKLATPVTGIVMTFVALAAMWGKHGGRYLGLRLAGTLCAAAVYWLFVLTGTTLSEGQPTALLIAIWLPHLAVLSIAAGVLGYKLRV